MSVYAFSDIHGRLDLLQQIQEFLKPDDKVYFLGNAGDRGPEPWKVIKEIAKDKRMICGSCTTGQTVLLNLDIFEEHIFKEETNHD